MKKFRRARIKMLCFPKLVDANVQTPKMPQEPKPRLSLKQGTQLVESAREAISAFLKQGRLALEKGTLGKQGVFVTLETFPARELRGCIGFPAGVKPLDEAVREAAVQSAFRDPRFPPLTEDELDKITIEVSVLTEPELVVVRDASEYLKKIVVGRDGLIAESSQGSGLLLPIVPVEYGWGVEEFLEALCQKAWLPPGAWRSSAVRIYAFQSQVFREETPGGAVVEVDFAREFGAKKKN